MPRYTRTIAGLVSGHVPFTLCTAQAEAHFSLVQDRPTSTFSDSRFLSRGFWHSLQSLSLCSTPVSACTPSATQTERQHKPPDCSRLLMHRSVSAVLLRQPCGQALSAWRWLAVISVLFVLAELLITPLGLLPPLRGAPPCFVGLSPPDSGDAAGALGYFIGGEVGALWSSWPTRDVPFPTALLAVGAVVLGSLGTEPQDGHHRT